MALEPVEWRAVSVALVEVWVQWLFHQLVQEVTSLLEQHLLMLKQALVDRAHIILHVTKDVSILQDLATAGNLLRSGAKEIQLAEWVVLDVVQQLYLVHDHRF